jgi:hypothetical protein
MADVWRLDDQMWETCMVKARAAWQGGDHEHAADLWQACHRLTLRFHDDDPRRAASLDTLARCDGAWAHLQEALEAWDRAQGWVDGMGTAQSARSSLFHLRLESKYPGAYPEIVRQRHRKTLMAGRAATLARCAALAGDEEAMREAMTLRRDTFGHREREAAAMAAWLGEPVTERQVDRFIEVPPRRANDEARLYAAALLFPILPEPAGD